jgi:hypothetical protein
MKIRIFNRIISALLVLACLIALPGCSGGMKAEEEQAVIRAVKSAFPGQDLESMIQKKVQANPSFSGISNGSYKWKINLVSTGVYYARYGYWGQHPWWKIGLGWVIAAVTYIFTLGFFSFNPWTMDSEALGLYYTFEANFNTDKLKILDKDPLFVPFDIDID